jgi:RNA polymerase sigma factor (TIGR02999 family)
MLTTEIVNQTYVNLRPARDLQWSEIPHFRSIVVLAMRRLMVDLARKRYADKRGGRNAVRVPISDVDVPDYQAAEYVLDLNRALDDLAGMDARQSTILELKYFGGLGNAEIAEELAISESTVVRDLRAAEAWLRVRLPPPREKE